MKKMYSVFLILSIALTGLFAQTPNFFQYQTEIRNTQGAVLPNQSVTMQFSLHKSTADGTIVFSETHNVTTNSNGIVSLQIGRGTPGTGSLTLGEIDWTLGAYFMQVEFKTGSTYTTISTQQLLSIPYAKYAQAAGNLLIKSPDGTSWNVTIGNSGELSATKVK